MAAVGVLAHFEAKPNTEQEMAEFFRGGLRIVDGQPATTRWFAFRIGPTSYGAFAYFDNEADREVLLSTGGPVSSARNAKLFAEAPVFQKIDILEARLAN
jgi:hypothetical protein